MKWWNIAVGVAGLVCAGGGVAVAGQTGAAVYAQHDAATGAAVRASLSGDGVLNVEIASETLTVRREVSRDRSTTRIVTPVEDLAITLSGDGVELRDRHRTIRASGRDRDAFSRVREQLRRSPAVHRAANLLAAVEVPARSPIAHTLLVTQSMLEHALGSPKAGAALSNWVRDLRTRVRITPASTQDGPTECWDEYAKEAIAAWIEYEECIENETWDLLGMFGCAAIYEMRAIGAFSWWVSCVGFRG